MSSSLPDTKNSENIAFCFDIEFGLKMSEALPITLLLIGMNISWKNFRDKHGISDFSLTFQRSYTIKKELLEKANLCNELSRGCIMCVLTIA